MNAVLDHLDQVSMFGRSSVAFFLILALDWTFSAVHAYDEWRGEEAPLWRVFGAIVGLRVPNVVGFLFFTLVLTPMILLSGVFFPVAQMPVPLQAVASVLPLKHAIDIARPLIAGEVPAHVALHLAVLLAYACAAFFVALVLTRRRLLK